ncbi:hypothetical protein V6N13_010047 [Hibiscus sabdariffa]|uniref:Uncharacterized protein n=1 Tax=Hibiscus sabdariffa TaxID=183260 RepID=A0ABR2PQX6_9ROSI
MCNCAVFKLLHSKTWSAQWAEARASAGTGCGEAWAGYVQWYNLQIVAFQDMECAMGRGKSWGRHGCGEAWAGIY